MEYETYETTTTLSAGEATILGGMTLFIVGLSLLFAIIAIVGMWKLFTKAGEPGWKAIVPVYNAWTFLKLGNQAGWWSLVALIPIVGLVSIVFMAIAAYNIGQKLGKESWWVVLYILLPIIWILVLAFDSSKWEEKAPGIIADPVAPASPAQPVETATDTDKTPVETQAPTQL